MIRNYQSLLEQYKDYKNSRIKIARLVKNGELTLVAANVYEDDPLMDDYFYAEAIYSPSYISFEYALFMYGLIPERAYHITSATLNKRKHKEKVGVHCHYYYQDIPSKAYSVGLEVIKWNGYSYTIASKEKSKNDLSEIFNNVNIEDIRKDLDYFIEDKEYITNITNKSLVASLSILKCIE